MVPRGMLCGAHLRPLVVGRLPPDDDLVIEGARRQQRAELGVRPADLPDGAFVAVQVCHGRPVLARHLEYLDGPIRAAGRQPPAVVVELGVVHHVGMAALKRGRGHCSEQEGAAAQRTNGTLLVRTKRSQQQALSPGRCCESVARVDCANGTCASRPPLRLSGVAAPARSAPLAVLRAPFRCLLPSAQLVHERTLGRARSSEPYHTLCISGREAGRRPQYWPTHLCEAIITYNSHISRTGQR